MKSSKTPIVFIDDDEQEIFEETDYLTPETHYSPKDKVSNLTWANRFPLGIDAGVRTIKRNEDFGCIVHLDYEKIINSSDVVFKSQKELAALRKKDAIHAIALEMQDRAYQEELAIFLGGNNTTGAGSAFEQDVLAAERLAEIDSIDD